MDSMTKYSLAQRTIVLIVVLLAGCTVGPHFHSPDPPMIGAYTPEPLHKTAESAGPAGISQDFNTNADIPAQWWTVFHSPALDRMVREALKHSPTLAQASDRLTEAQEELNARAGETKYPRVTGNASAQREQVNLSSFGVPFPNPKPFTLLSGSVAVSYALDLFGANRHLIESLRAQVAYQGWQLQAARLMLAGNVVSAAIQQAELQSQIDITRRMIDVQQQQIDISERRYRAGGISRSDLQSQRTDVAQTKAELPALQQQLDAVDDQLAVLMGNTPAEAQIELVKLDGLMLPADLPVSLPSAVVRQRPDILAAESLLRKACANVGVAAANLYPQITLSGEAGGVGTRFNHGGGIWNFEAALTQPIYNGGALRAEKREAVADYDEAGSAYRETVLEAFRQVADTLRAIEHDAETLQLRTEAESEAASNYTIASERYKTGGISELALLDAQRRLLQARLLQSKASADRFRDSATLFQALGGGWWNR
jgi:NodT family efflux transporter outer membrane factor (OMF) lipoprotein